MCGGAVGTATLSGPQGTYKVPASGTYNLLENQDQVTDLDVYATFDHNELRQVDMQLGGGYGTEPDRIVYKSDGSLTVNGKACTGDMVTANGTRISFNGGKLNITSPDGDTFSMYQTKCSPPAINIEGQIASNRPQGEVTGMVGTFDDSIPQGDFNLGNGTSGGSADTAFFDSWLSHQLAEAESADEKRRQQELAAAYAASGKAAANAAAAAAAEAGRASERTKIAGGDLSAAGGADLGLTSTVPAATGTTSTSATTGATGTGSGSTATASATGSTPTAGSGG